MKGLPHRSSFILHRSRSYFILEMTFTRDRFAQRFGRRAVIGMVHLAPLPGTPLYSGSLDMVIARALPDAEGLVQGGVDAIAIENFGDRPFRKNRVDPETIAVMTRVVAEMARVISLPFG